MNGSVRTPLCQSNNCASNIITGRFVKLRNYVVYQQDGNGSVISSEGFEPVPEPDIHDTPGRGLILGGKSALKYNTIQKSGSKMKVNLRSSWWSYRF